MQGLGRKASTRLKTQQYETRKNDEFRAMGNEIERYEKEIQSIEDQELELMDQAEKLKVEVSAEEKKAAAIAGIDCAANGRSRGEGQDARGAPERIDERANRAGRAKSMKICSGRFERLFASKGDAAIVALEHEVCTGCHMKVTTQTAHRVRNGKEIVSCEQCGRILYAA